jgi:hypothetical protein
VLGSLERIGDEQQALESLLPLLYELMVIDMSIAMQIRGISEITGK